MHNIHWISIYSIWHCNAIAINHLCSFKNKHNNSLVSRHVHEIKQFHILRAAQKVLSGSGSQLLVIVCVRDPAGTDLLVFFSIPSTHWAVVLVGGWTEAALSFSLPSINLCHKSVRQREKELLNTDLSAINLTSITRLGYCVLHYCWTISRSHTEHSRARVSCYEQIPSTSLDVPSMFFHIL